MLHPHYDINCLLPGYLLIKINVQKNHTIEKIQNVIGKNVTLIYNGIVLQPGNTLGYYNITAGCSLIAVNPEKKGQIDYWKDLSPKSDFFDRMNGTHVLSREQESTRLKDLRLAKMELKSKSFARRLSQQNFSPQGNNTSEVKVTPSFYKKPEAICSDPLPIFWGQKSTTNSPFNQIQSFPDIIPDETQNSEPVD